MQLRDFAAFLEGRQLGMYSHVVTHVVTSTTFVFAPSLHFFS